MVLTKNALKRMKAHGARERLSDGRVTNYGLELMIYREFERCCKIAGLVPEEEVELETLAETKSGTVGTARRLAGGRSIIELDFNKLKSAVKGIASTVAHEVAHCWIFRDFGRVKVKSHGTEWAERIIKLGYPPEKSFNWDIYKN
jgi:hypothetical protein